MRGACRILVFCPSVRVRSGLGQARKVNQTPVNSSPTPVPGYGADTGHALPREPKGAASDFASDLLD